jgi:single-strand DNA-binding protein
MNTIRNKVQLIGNLGKAPEVREFDKGKKMARFSVATNESYKNAQGEWETQTTWHNLVAWGNQASLCERKLNKGSEVAIEGKLVSRSYTDKEGNKKYVTEVQVNEILVLSRE